MSSKEFSGCVFAPLFDLRFCRLRWEIIPSSPSSFASHLAADSISSAGTSSATRNAWSMAEEEWFAARVKESLSPRAQIGNIRDGDRILTAMRLQRRHRLEAVATARAGNQRLHADTAILTTGVA
jgi:hypothetical protein